MLSDTHPEAEAVQLELLRRASVAEKFNQVRELTRIAVYHARRAIARANPDCTQRELDLIFVETHYGRDLAGRLREYLDARDEAQRSGESFRVDD